VRLPYSEIGNRREIIAWALYDWGNSAFATVIIAGFFPVFLKQYWAADTDVTISSFRLGLANSAASLLVLSMAPVLGAIADQGTFKKRFLISFAAVGIIATGALFFVSSGQWLLAVVLYVIGGVGFASANIFYDALLVDVTQKRHLDVVSALGFALGYLGGGLFLAFCAYLTARPETFGLDSSTHAVRVSFLLVALWWAIFTVPLWRYVREHRTKVATTLKDASILGIHQLRNTFRAVRRYRQIIIFLGAYWLYIDGVDTIVRMAVDYGVALGFTSQHLILALLVTQFVGFPAAIAFGWIGQRLSAKSGILIGLVVYIGVTLWAYKLEHVWEFYAIAVTIGLVQGGVQSLSRSLYARLIPENSSAEFFGFYNLLGKFAAVIGPALMGGMAYWTHSTRLSILSLLVLFVGGAILLLFVNDKAPPPQS
jgi:UMF1 family MFS transporter